MKKFSIPIESYSHIDVYANSFEEALKILEQKNIEKENVLESWSVDESGNVVIDDGECEETMHFSEC